MKSLIVVLAAVTLTGCAGLDRAIGGNSTEYTEYAAAQVKIAEANALAQKYKYEALVLMSKDASDAAKVAAVMSLQNSGVAIPQQTLNQPKSMSDTALQWASVLMPSLTQMYSISANKELGLANTAAQVQNTQVQTAASVQNTAAQIGGFVKFGELINAPTVVTQPAPIIVPQQVVNPVVVQPQIVQVR
jgi:uncharacterized protein YceK